MHADEVEAEPVTEQLCSWIHELQIEKVPVDVLERARYLILDGIACGLVGSHVPWSEQLAKAIAAFEPSGSCAIIGYKEVRNSDSLPILNVSAIDTDLSSVLAH
jgi:aconitate decarboxylase